MDNRQVWSVSDASQFRCKAVPIYIPLHDGTDVVAFWRVSGSGCKFKMFAAHRHRQSNGTQARLQEIGNKNLTTTARDIPAKHAEITFCLYCRRRIRFDVQFLVEIRAEIR